MKTTAIITIMALLLAFQMIGTSQTPGNSTSDKYCDLHSLAGMVPESLGVGFVGDGTAGAGGMGLG